MEKKPLFIVHFLTSMLKSTFFLLKNKKNTVKPVYKDHSREPENVAIISSCPLYTG